MFIVQSEKPYTYEVLQEDARLLAREYPFLHFFSLGSSVAGRSITAVRWGVGAKHIFLNGAHHGMEWITAMLLMRMAEEVSHQYIEHTAIGTVRFRELYDEISLVFCPMVNPDGVHLQINGLTDDMPPLLQTRLKAYNGNSTDFSKWQANLNGVDLNHNYDAGFEKGLFLQHRLGIYGPGPTRFSGTAPESEPESKAVADFTRSFKPQLAVAYHTQGEEIFYDYESKAPTRSKAMAAAMAEISGYAAAAASGMASCSGYKDWVIKEFYIPAFTIECGFGENPLPLCQFEKIYHDNLKMLLYLVRAI